MTQLNIEKAIHNLFFNLYNKLIYHKFFIKKMS